VDKRTGLYEKTADTQAVFASSSFEEALARLDFVVDSGQSLAIVSGSQGSGRSTLLEVFSREARRRGHPVGWLGLWGQKECGWWWDLAAALGTNPPLSRDPFLLAYRIQDHLQQQRLLGRRTLLLLDDADRAAEPVLSQVLRLLKTPKQCLTTILTAETSRMRGLGDSLLQLSQLHIRLEPWTAADIAAYVQQKRDHLGGKCPSFDPSAVDRLKELTGGLPHRILQLAEWVRLAAIAEHHEWVDRPMVEGVFRELSLSAESDPEMAATW